MTNYIVTRTYRENRRNSSKKPNSDFSDICVKHFDFVRLDFIMIANKVLRAPFVEINWRNQLRKIKKNDIVWIQFPLYSSLGTNILFNYCKKVKAKIIILIHDIQYLRDFPTMRNEEISWLNRADTIIAHNDSMKQQFINDGVFVNIVTLKIFDFLDSNPFVTKLKKEDPIIFAGNLDKAPFLRKMDQVYPVNAFGITKNKKFPMNVNYFGSFDQEELAYELQGSFSLIWDGDSTETCSGPLGEYLKINNPYKVSMSLALGIPVIIWKKAALANFVSENKLGICVNSLQEIKYKINELSESEYQTLIINAKKQGEKLRNSFYSKDVIKTILSNNGD